jgi:hypothetical protein
VEDVFGRVEEFLSCLREILESAAEFRNLLFEFIVLGCNLLGLLDDLLVLVLREEYLEDL